MFKKFFKKAYAVCKDERGIYGGVELMFILAGVAFLVTGVMAPFKGNGTTTGLPGAASSVSSMIQNTINTAANNE